MIVTHDPAWANQFRPLRNQDSDFPITEYLGNISLTVPFSGGLPEEQVDYVGR